MPDEGSPAPDFTLPDQDGNDVSLADLKGQTTVLYFYPDEDHAVAEKYGTWVEKSMYGKKYMGVQRSTFIIDGDGKVAKVFEKVSPKTHDDVLLKALAEL